MNDPRRCIITLAARDDLAFVLTLRERLDALSVHWPLVFGCLDAKALRAAGEFSHRALIPVDATGGQPLLNTASHIPDDTALLFVDPRIDFQTSPRPLLNMDAPAVIYGSGGGAIRAAFAGTAEGREALRSFATGQKVPTALRARQPSAKPWAATENQPLDFTGTRLVMNRFLVADQAPSAPMTLNLLLKRYQPWAETAVRLAETVRRTDPDHAAVPETPRWLGPEHALFTRNAPPTPLLEIPQLAVTAHDTTLYLPASAPGADKVMAAKQSGQVWPVIIDAAPRNLCEADEALESGDFDSALQGYNAALLQNRFDSDAFHGFARALAGQGNTQAVIDACLFHLDSCPNDQRAQAVLHAAREDDLDLELANSERDDTGYLPREFLATALVSTYASEEFIEECLTDLEGQSVAKDLEIIVIDADSPENERDVVRRFQEQYDNIRYIRTRGRIGIYRAWNLALHVATGRFATPFSTNDRLAPDAYETLSNFLDENPDIDLAFGDTWLTDLPHQTFGNHTPSATSEGKWAWPGYYFSYNLFSCTGGPHPMFRRHVIDTFGYFDERYSALSDQDFFLRLGRAGKIRHTPVFTGLAWLSESALSDESKTQDELREIRSRFQASYCADVCANSILENLIANLDTMLMHQGIDAARKYYGQHRSRLPEMQLMSDLDKLLDN